MRGGNMFNGCIFLLVAIFLYIGYRIDKYSESNDAIIGWFAYFSVVVMLLVHVLIIKNVSTFDILFPALWGFLGYEYELLVKDVKDFEKEEIGDDEN